MKDIDKAAVYKFLQKVIDKRTPEEAVHLLQDIIVNNCIFPGAVESVTCGADEQFIGQYELDQQIVEFMIKGEKFRAVKTVQDFLALTLKEAMDYVEATDSRVALSTIKKRHITFFLEKQQIAANEWMKKVIEDYGI